ncbi:MAG TPA: GNAT family N-acetyltransferase [Methylomusa anaerophila]|uniref:Acetyltransferase (GNAT) family protein n=1 Tax=Methylomusa anaerophila TaxID=1930071 RepID=A0A348AIN5_9FIRM|nr:GNAT family N-acetyltransferase [Methylomusa anaerophila]BBB90933.1 acetyltransferase (GNAT) family protein [Methylomusa anaerophila]HML90439.1 GNAT family N-acetyltransferase [Methylomusa anaerophila]
MELRKANIADTQRLVALRKQQLLDEGITPVHNIDLELKNYFLTNLSNNTFISWVAIENNNIIATSGICFYQLPPSYTNPSGRIAYVTNMFTVKNYRRQGIASQLLKKVIEEAKNLNYNSVRLHASSDGKNLYTKIGFVDLYGYMTLKL